jgi:hypothetical protein
MYQLIELPECYLKEDRLSADERNELLQWFIESSPERISQLFDYISETSGEKVFQPGYKEADLKTLAIWLKQIISKRQMTDTERAFRDEQISELPKFVSEYVCCEIFTDETLSLVFDVAMFYADFIMNTIDGIEVQVKKGSEKNANKDSVVLTGFDGMEMNIVSIVMNLFSRLYDGKEADAVFIQNYKHWKSLKADGAQKVMKRIEKEPGV